MLKVNVCADTSCQWRIEPEGDGRTRLITTLFAASFVQSNSRIEQRAAPGAYYLTMRQVLHTWKTVERKNVSWKRCCWSL